MPMPFTFFKFSCHTISSNPSSNLNFKEDCSLEKLQHVRCDFPTNYCALLLCVFALM